MWGCVGAGLTDTELRRRRLARPRLDGTLESLLGSRPRAALLSTLFAPVCELDEPRRIRLTALTAAMRTGMSSGYEEIRFLIHRGVAKRVPGEHGGVFIEVDMESELTWALAELVRVCAATDRRRGPGHRPERG